ncbi:MAG: polysaccharide deacetylase family protein [Oscillospiraceae bacterium]|nr:polysaccharide deacetylase family protein [Oscillospiraceae bacterium]
MTKRKWRIAVFCCVFLLLALTAAACQRERQSPLEDAGSALRKDSYIESAPQEEQESPNGIADPEDRLQEDEDAARQNPPRLNPREPDGKAPGEERMNGPDGGKLLADVRGEGSGCEALRETVARMVRRNEKTAMVPILMYHHVADEASPMTIPRDRMEEQFAALKAAGYETVFLSELRDYVLSGGELPEKPIVITFDDGYLSNATEAFPLLEKYDMKATIFIIGVSFGKDSYKDTGAPMIPHFGKADALSMLRSGHVELGSHTYDLHQWPQMETGGDVRENMSKHPGDTLEQYLSIIRKDAQAFSRFYRETFGESTCLFSYPYGEITKEAAGVLLQEGYTVTVSTDPGMNTIVRGKPETLREMYRYTVYGDMSSDEVLAMLQP